MLSEGRQIIKDYVEKPTGAVTLKLTAISSAHDRDFRDRQTCLLCGAPLLCCAVLRPLGNLRMTDETSQYKTHCLMSQDL